MSVENRPFDWQKPPQRLELGKHLATATYYQVYEVAGFPDLVVKRFSPNQVVVDRFGSKDAVKAQIETEEQQVASHMPDFMPRTLKLNLDLGSGPEEVLVQEKNTGQASNTLRAKNITQEEAERLSVSYQHFCEEYRSLRNSGAIIENEVSVDLTKGTIVIYDANNLRQRDTLALEAARIFELCGDRPASFSAEDILAFLRRNFSDLPSVRGGDEITFLDAFRPDGGLGLTLAHQLVEELLDAQNFTPEEKENIIFELSIDLNGLLKSLTYFPPHTFKHNLFTLDLGRKLGQIPPRQ